MDNKNAERSYKNYVQRFKYMQGRQRNVISSHFPVIAGV